MNSTATISNSHTIPILAQTLAIILCVLSFMSIVPVESSSLTIKIPSGASNPNNNVWYEPPIAIIQVGQNISWINLDSSLHTVTNGTFFSGPVGTYDSGILNSGETSRPWKFDSSGTFSYYCTLHPFMSGQVLVVQAP